MKKTVTVILLTALVVSMAACGLVSSIEHDTPTQSALPAVTENTSATQIEVIPTDNPLKKTDVEYAVRQYNDAISGYNSAVDKYNAGISAFSEAIELLETAIESAKETLENNSNPYDPKTATELLAKIAVAESSCMPIPEELDHKEQLYIPVSATQTELEEVYSAAICGLEIPEQPDVPDYTVIINELQLAQNAYILSVKSMEQVTAPTIVFIIERLKAIDTIIGVGEVKPHHDPNKMLGKQGGYIACLYFSDSRVDKAKLNIIPSKNNPIDIGTIGGGSIEVYATAEDALDRNAYLATFDGTESDPGSHVVVGTLVIRTSSRLTDDQQRKLTEQITSVLIRVDL